MLAMRSPTALRLGLLLLSLVLAAPASAEDSPITSNSYQLDKVDGPVLASSRILGMGGAATALATAWA